MPSTSHCSCWRQWCSWSSTRGDWGFHVWLYVLGAALIAISVTFPLYLIAGSAGWRDR
jgi:hypothetical protein